MKHLASYILFLLPFLLQAQSTPNAVRISKLEVDSKKVYRFNQPDSILSIVIDTLVMKDRSKVHFLNKKDVSLVINHAYIGTDCLLTGTDGKNNGTNMNISANFAQLKNLIVDMAGLDARAGNRRFLNGNGGNVSIKYMASGVVPQTADKRRSNYISVINKGAGFRVNAQNDVAVVLSQIGGRAPGVPLAGLPNGRVYSGNTGTDGKFSIIKVESFID